VSYPGNSVDRGLYGRAQIEASGGAAGVHRIIRGVRFDPLCLRFAEALENYLKSKLRLRMIL